VDSTVLSSSLGCLLQLGIFGIIFCFPQCAYGKLNTGTVSNRTSETIATLFQSILPEEPTRSN
jgi:hypothetical protein